MAPPVPKPTILFLLMAISFGLLAACCYANNYLVSGESLSAGQSITNGGYSLRMQTDCNLVLHDHNSQLWSSQTAGNGDGCRLILELDGKLVIYNKYNWIVWYTQPNSPKGKYVLVLQKDRNLVIYGPSAWATNTTTTVSAGENFAGELNSTYAENYLVTPESLNADQSLTYGGYRFIMQPNCNLILYDVARVIWQTRTARAGPCRVVLDHDGKLVLYNNRNAIIWHTEPTTRHGIYVLLLQKDRDVVIYGPAVWQTYTATATATTNGVEANISTVSTGAGELSGPKIAMVTE